MISLRLPFRIIGLVLVGAFSLAALPTSEAQDVEAGRALLAKASAALEGVSHSRARYTQTQNLATLLRPRVTRGTLYFRREPACLLLHVDPDAVLRIRMDETSHLVVRPRDKRAERYLFDDNHLNRALMRCFTSEIGKLEEAFEIKAHRAAAEEGGAAQLDLVPRDEKTKAFLTLLTLTIDPKGAIRAIDYADAGGDRVTIELEDVRSATARAEDEAFRKEIAPLFDAPLPDGVELFERRVESRGKSD